MRRFPLITLALCTLCSGLMLLPGSALEVLYLRPTGVDLNHISSLVTGHLVHADAAHWFWNTLALAVLGGYLERRSRLLLSACLLVGVVSINLLLTSPLSDLARYCGLSGVLNTLLGVALYDYWLETRSRWVVLAGLLCVAKVVAELLLNTALLTDISWAPYPPAHLAGLLGACLIVAGIALRGLSGSSRKIRSASRASPA